MPNGAFYPFCSDADVAIRHPRMAAHFGQARIEVHGDPNNPLSELSRHLQRQSGQKEPDLADERFEAVCLVPACGAPLIMLRGPSTRRLGPNFGKMLTMSGVCPEGEFELVCPEYYVRLGSEDDAEPGWALAEPVNEPAVISYGATRPVIKVEAVINNFDFERGDSSLCVDADGKAVDFCRRAHHSQLKQLVAAGVLPTAAFNAFSFDAWDKAADTELMVFAQDVASLCSYAVGQHTGISVLTLSDSDERPVRRILVRPVQSRYRPGGILIQSQVIDGVKKLFQKCFAEHVRMRQSSLPWRRLPIMCACIEDAPYLEHKFAALMMAMEFFLKNVLFEDGHTPAEKVAEKTLESLISTARGFLRWDIPKHYTPKRLFPQLRNAVMHGGELPTVDADELRHTFDKWRLFLQRRVLMRLGYDGRVSSPEQGWASASQVNDFTERHNSFG